MEKVELAPMIDCWYTDANEPRHSAAPKSVLDGKCEIPAGRGMRTKTGDLGRYTIMDALAAQKESQMSSGQTTPELVLDRTRKFCTCCMKRKTQWVWHIRRCILRGEMYLKVRVCWRCMSLEQREAIRREF